MKIIKLTHDHIHSIRGLFDATKFMGVNHSSFQNLTGNFPDFLHESFSSTYLSGLTYFHAYGAIDDAGIIHATIGFYESIDDPSWYWTHVRNNGNPKLIKLILDEVIKHNEARGRLKFYTMFPSKYITVYRRLAFSSYNSERYESVDECIVPARTQCAYTLPWQILYSRSMSPVETVVRCTILKKQYRTVLPIAGCL